VRAYRSELNAAMILICYIVYNEFAHRFGIQ
jgi:hypothetical protein